MTERLTEEVLQELLEAPSLDGFIGSHDFPAATLPDFLEHMLQKKGLKRSRVVRMADLSDIHGRTQPVARQGAADRVRHGAVVARNESGA